MRNNVSIDWTIKESVRAKIRVLVKRILRKYGYPPDKHRSLLHRPSVDARSDHGRRCDRSGRPTGRPEPLLLFQPPLRYAVPAASF